MRNTVVRAGLVRSDNAAHKAILTPSCTSRCRVSSRSVLEPSTQQGVRLVGSWAGARSMPLLLWGVPALMRGSSRGAACELSFVCVPPHTPERRFITERLRSNVMLCYVMITCAVEYGNI